MQATEARCRGDLELLQKLSSRPEVKKAAEEAAKGPDSARYQLLATALRLAPGMAPDIDALIARSIERLGVKTDVEAFIYSDPQFNAGCVRPENGRVFLMFSSSLIEAFSPSELAFVVGHELGHHLFEHHQIPVHRLIGGEKSAGAGAALELFAWQRYAEISADRAGLLAAGDLEGAAGALFKLASGLRGNTIKVDAKRLIDQAADMGEEQHRQKKEDARADWFATHPFSPLRLRAADACQRSIVMRADGQTLESLEAEVAELMALMEPRYLQEKSDAAEAMRRLLLSAGLAVAAASNGIQDEELSKLHDLFGEGTLARRLNSDALIRDLPRRIEEVNRAAPQARRAQVVRDLCLIALADGHADAEERRVLSEIAAQIGVGAYLVDRWLTAPKPLD